MADDLNMMRENRVSGAGASASVDDDPLTRRFETTRRFGRSGLQTNEDRLYTYDRTQGKKTATHEGEFSLASEMQWADAKGYMVKIHDAYGVGTTLDGQRYDFDHMMFLAYAVNGGSAIMPSDRVSFTVGGTRFEFETLMTILGVHFRRWFRAYANGVLGACRHLHDHCDFNNPAQVEMRDKMISVARRRGLLRAPWLVADCLDNAKLSAEEGYIVDNAKAGNVGKTVNSVDRRAHVTPVVSADSYDSSVGGTVPVQTPSGGAAPQYFS